MVRVTDIFRIGIGPSSSHTVGPMRAAASFAAQVRGLDFCAIRCELLGSLAWTGEGHATDKAVILGLAGFQPDTIDPSMIDIVAERVRSAKQLTVGGREVVFDPSVDIAFNRYAPTPVHPNTLSFVATGASGEEVLNQRWCSIGGGFVMLEDRVGIAPADDTTPSPYPFRSAADLLDVCEREELTIAEVVAANEATACSEVPIEDQLDRLIEIMMGCIDRGIAADGFLPGRLNVRRRANGIWRKIEAEKFDNRPAPHAALDHVSLFAIAVNEENAAGGRVVTAPTNGAAGVIPAVLRYYRDLWPGADRAGMHTLLLTSAAIGMLVKLNASISGAEVGCQGEVGTASAMAAAGLAAAMGATNNQVENAAEIAMEHHLGMTCDPIGGLVQVPCIERNAFGAVKAINAASLALRGDGEHIVSLDQVIETMMRTGRDMSTKYKETSQGGLAVSFPEC